MDFWIQMSGTRSFILLDLLKQDLFLIGVDDVPFSRSSQASASSHAPSEAYDDVRPLAWAAFVQQSEPLGWENHLWGHLSKLWGVAFFQESMACQQWVNKNQWASNVVEQLLHYSQSLWQFCCSLLHGRTGSGERNFQLAATFRATFLVQPTCRFSSVKEIEDLGPMGDC